MYSNILNTATNRIPEIGLIRNWSINTIQKTEIMLRNPELLIDLSRVTTVCKSTTTPMKAKIESKIS